MQKSGPRIRSNPNHSRIERNQALAGLVYNEWYIRNGPIVLHLAGEKRALRSFGKIRSNSVGNLTGDSFSIKRQIDGYYIQCMVAMCLSNNTAVGARLA